MQQSSYTCIESGNLTFLIYLIRLSWFRKALLKLGLNKNLYDALLMHILYKIDLKTLFRQD